MITFMQRHRKWLVITIWISTIAFVGAGFVGWGAYDFNLNRTSSVAKVGDEKIGFMEFDRRFSQLFGYYNQLSNGALTEQAAREQGLESVALQSLIDDKLLLNFAKDLGIGAGEDEIIRILMADKEFADESGNFSKEIYYKLLAENDLDAKEYEQMLSDSIILNKLGAILNLPVSETELKMLGSNFFMRDNLSIAVVKADENLKIKVDENELKALWEQYKEEFKTSKYYEISSFFLPAKSGIDADKKALNAFYDKNKQKYTDFSGKILAFDAVENQVREDFALESIKSEANQIYLALNKKEREFERDLNITDKDVYFPLEQINSAKIGGLVKPFIIEQNGRKGYMIVRVNSIQPVRVKSFEEARAEILPLYNLAKKREALQDKATKALANFKGKNIGQVSRDTKRIEKIANKDVEKVDVRVMNDEEFGYFLMNVFNSNESKSFVLFDDKAVLYSINDQNLISNAKFKAMRGTLEQNVRNIKANEIRKELLAQLKTRYKTQIYYEGAKN